MDSTELGANHLTNIGDSLKHFYKKDDFSYRVIPADDRLLAAAIYFKSGDTNHLRYLEFAEAAVETTDAPIEARLEKYQKANPEYFYTSLGVAEAAWLKGEFDSALEVWNKLGLFNNSGTRQAITGRIQGVIKDDEENRVTELGKTYRLSDKKEQFVIEGHRRKLALTAAASYMESLEESPEENLFSEIITYGRKLAGVNDLKFTPEQIDSMMKITDRKLTECSSIETPHMQNPSFHLSRLTVRVGEQSRSFDVRAILAHGSTAQVYYVKDEKTQKGVAAKVENPYDLGNPREMSDHKRARVVSQGQAFQDIAQVQEKLSGKAFCPQVIGTGTIPATQQSGEREYVVMEIARGINMRDLPYPLTTEVVLDLAKQYATIFYGTIKAGYTFVDYEAMHPDGKNMLPKDAIYDPTGKEIVMFDYTLGNKMPPLEEIEKGTPEYDRRYQAARRDMNIFTKMIRGLMSGKGQVGLLQKELTERYYLSHPGIRDLIGILERATKNEQETPQSFFDDITRLIKDQNPAVDPKSNSL